MLWCGCCCCHWRERVGCRPRPSDRSRLDVDLDGSNKSERDGRSRVAASFSPAPLPPPLPPPADELLSPVAHCKPHRPVEAGPGLPFVCLSVCAVRLSGFVGGLSVRHSVLPLAVAVFAPVGLAHAHSLSLSLTPSLFPPFLFLSPLSLVPPLSLVSLSPSRSHLTCHFLCSLACRLPSLARTLSPRTDSLSPSLLRLRSFFPVHPYNRSSIAKAVCLLSE